MNGNGQVTDETTPQPGALVRQDFGGSEMETRAETASTAVAAQARAAVESRYVMALRRPRDWDDVRARLLRACARPRFAATARYRKPIGKGVEGPSIRFAEEAARSMTNVMPEASVIYEDEAKRIVRVTVTDLEANVTYGKDIVVEKTVERSSLKEGQEPISVRVNSQGRRTYLVPATDDDMLNKENALVSKALRTAILRLLPGDIMEECMDAVAATQRNSDARDPDAARKQIADAFARLNVMPAALKDYLGHELAQCSPAELSDLRALWQAINEGAVTWADALEHRRGQRGEDVEDDGKKGTAGLRAKVAKPKQVDFPMADDVK